MTSLSFRAKLAVAIGALILVIAVAISAWLPRKLEREAMTLVAHKAETLAQLTAFTIQPSLYFGDTAALQEALSGTRGDKDVAYIVVVDPAGRRLAAFHFERATERGLALRAPSGTVSADGSLYEVALPIRDGHELARLHIGVSLDRLNRSVSELRLTVAALSVTILVAGLIAALLISGFLTRPLREVAAGAQRIAAGELRQRVPEHGDDEIGRLASSFNDMAVRVAERDAELRRLSRRLLAIQEEERVRIAREVHDELGQALTAMKIDLQQISRANPSLEPQLGSVSRSIDATVDLVRQIASDLRPSILDDLGITAALEQQLRRLRESTGIATTLHVAEEPQLDRLTGATLYRIVQEALSNVARHAHATEVTVSLAVAGEAAVLEVQDDGEGITPEAVASRGSLGLLGIRERAQLLGGTVTIEGGRGTRLTVRLPLEREESDESTLH